LTGTGTDPTIARVVEAGVIQGAGWVVLSAVGAFILLVLVLSFLTEVVWPGVLMLVWLVTGPFEPGETGLRIFEAGVGLLLISAALDAFRAADNPIDQQLILDLGTMVARTRDEIDRMTVRLASDAT
jgi:hypothetical protein